MKSKLLVSNNSDELIIFMAGWGSDNYQYENISSSKDVVIFYDYSDLTIDFDFSSYRKFYLLAFSSGVFVSALIKDKLPKLSLTVAANGNINLFDQNLGLDDFIVKLFKSIDLSNYMDFRRNYLCFSDEELELFNKYSCRRSSLSCSEEIDALYKYYKEHTVDLIFDKVLLSDSDRIFKPKYELEYYLGLKSTEVYRIENANHNIFTVHLKDFDDLLNPSSAIYSKRIVK